MLPGCLRPPRPLRMVPPSRPLLAGIVLLATAALASGCAPAVDVAPAPTSADPACAPMMVALPDTLDGQQLRETSSQGTAAWGNPAKIILRCGVKPPGPTTDQCVSVNGVDWVIRQSGVQNTTAAVDASPSPSASIEAGNDNEIYTVTTYGRSPATELIFNQRDVSSSNVLAQISAAALKVPQQRKCLGPPDLSPVTSALGLPASAEILLRNRSSQTDRAF